MFDDVLKANRNYAASFELDGLPAVAARGLAVITCIDSRIEPLAMLGLQPGDAKILRNAGARVTTDVLRTLILATNLLGVDRICVVAHTDCAMTKSTDAELQSELGERHGTDANGWAFRTIADQVGALHADIELIRACDLIADQVEVAGFVYDVHTGLLQPI